MKRIILDRFAYTKFGTFGTLSVNNGSAVLFACKTLENPWLMNSRFQSCIPSGVYDLVRGNFKGKYENYELLDVPHRDHIEFHIGNQSEDTDGCILLGGRYRIDDQYQKYWITKSRETFGKFMAAMQGDPKALLIIRENLISTVGLA